MIKPKRIFASLIALVVLAAPALAQTPPVAVPSLPIGPATVAVAFDQVNIISMGPYASSPGDFAKEAAAVEALAAARAADPAHAPAAMFPSKSLEHIAFLHGQSRTENVLTHTVILMKPGEIDVLDTVKKTYRKTQTALPGANPLAGLFPAPSGSPNPGTVDLSFGFDAAAAAPVTIAGQSARSYTYAFSAKADDATGSCVALGRGLDLRGTITNDVLERPEPAVGNATGAFFTPESFARFPFFDPRYCALHALTMRMTNLPDLLAFSEFYLYRRIEIQPGPTSSLPIRPTIIFERGNVHPLTDADAPIFEIPADYTLAQ